MSAAAPLLPELRPWIETIWVEAAGAGSAAAREHSLPSGSMHLAIRLDGPPLRLYADADDRVGRVYSHAVVGGMRASYCIKDTSLPSSSVGAVLQPGAALALFGVSAAELEGGHTDLRALCGAKADELQARLAACVDPRRRQAVFERFLRAQLRPVRGLDPQIVDAVRSLQRAAPMPALARLGAVVGESDEDDARIAALAQASGRSHRRFIAGFRDLAGLTPKRYARVLRFKGLLAALAATPRPDWAQLALDAGYFDQSHLIREFREFAGVSPRAYVAAAAASPHHLPMRETATSAASERL
ncbi:helix-turn-helix domain-containing protein [Pseudomonas sp. CGJS7]|uniref:helix-turn-helix domain-containing protein n=1 Tax=Pseudomonas sp. CGJS7 TaxID=3109348 RepID=UPI00300A27CD